MDKTLKDILLFISDRFNLTANQEREDNVVAEIRRGVEFRGINVWVLVFAIMVASVGLNVNATAVIIGAMLISPLMGPIMGIGLGLGIGDVQLIRKAATNLAVMVVISIITSSFYFAISPLAEAQSELLARTNPTTWDVLIAFFGGLAGIVATASKERGNVVPGVAIATALMPPLCTAGFGIATGNLQYFLGAFYLFSINAVFICLSTLLIVRFLHFHEVSFVSPEMKKKVRTAIGVFVVAMILPSVYIARNLVLDTLYKKKVQTFVNTVFNFPTTEVIKVEPLNDKGEKVITVSLMGDPIDANTIANLNAQMSSHQLAEAKLVVKQGTNYFNTQDLKSQVLEEVLSRNMDSLASKDARIETLSNQLAAKKNEEMMIAKIAKEAAKLEETVEKLSIQQAIYFNSEGKPVDTIHIALAHFNKQPQKQQVTKLEEWLATRLEVKKVRILID